MKRSRFTEEQVAYALRQAEAGTPVGDVCRQLGIAEATVVSRVFRTFVGGSLIGSQAAASSGSG